MEFSTTLLREKFVIRDASRADGDPGVTALSNRVCVALHDTHGKLIETFIIRTQAMHTCIRMAAKIIHSYNRHGPIMVRAEKFDFDEAWNDIVTDYERQYNEKSWVAVYNGGKRIYGSNEYHAFLDVIENCENRNKTGNYDSSVLMAEDIFAQRGKSVSIDYEGNTGMVLDIKKNRARCGLILRSPTKRTNFNYTAEEKPEREDKINVPQCLTSAAAFLEGIQLAFQIGRVNERLRLNQTAKYSDEDRKATAARRRLARLNAEIKNFENVFSVNYRPERPEFGQIITEAERFTRAQIEKDIANKLAEQAIDLEEPVVTEE